MATSSRPDRKSSETSPASAPGRPASRSGSKKKKTAKTGGASKTAPKKTTARQPATSASKTAQTPPVVPPEFPDAPVAPSAPPDAKIAGPAPRPDAAIATPQPEAGSEEAMAMSAPLPAAEDPARLPDRPSDVSAPEASQSEPAKAPVTAPVRPAYDVTDFLAGVFEGLPGSADLSLDCVVDPRADTLAVERLLYFSQALQLLFSAFRSPGMDRRHPAEKTAPQRLHIRLDLGPGERIGLRLYDDGHFFAQLLPSLHWDEEALRPLRLFVSRKGGSLCLRRGRCVEFEIIG